MQKVFLYTAGMAACFLLQGVFYYCLILVAHPIGSRICERIRIIIGEHLRKLPMGYFAEKSSGSLNALVSDELMMLAHTPTMIFPQVVTAVTLPIIFAPFLFSIDWRMAAVTLAVIPLSMPFFLIAQKTLRAGMKKRSDSLVDASSKVVEYIQGIEVARSFNQTGRRFRGLDDVLLKFKNSNLAMALKAIPVLLSFKAVLDFGFTFILLAGAHLFLGGKISLQVFLVFLIVGLRVYEPIKYLALAFELVRINEVTMERIHQVLEAQPLPQPVVGQAPKTFDIEFRNVTFRYNQRRC
jgi:ATP-binding cassette subfamily B protein